MNAEVTRAFDVQWNKTLDLCKGWISSNGFQAGLEWEKFQNLTAQTFIFTQPAMQGLAASCSFTTLGEHGGAPHRMSKGRILLRNQQPAP